jgi:hypothetical protein
MATPRKPTVPENWRWPLGPWKQAPPEYGGEWWQVWGPFGHPRPWEIEGQPLASAPPADFVAVLGPRPHRNDLFYGEWNDNLKDWKGVGLPPWMTQADLDTANEVYGAYEMGKAVVYEGRYGWRLRWPETGHFEFEGDARSHIMTGAMHHKVAEFQDFLRNKGLPVPRPHPFLPPALK